MAKIKYLKSHLWQDVIFFFLLAIKNDTLTLFMKCDLVCIIIASSYIQQRDTSRIKLQSSWPLLVNKMLHKSRLFTLLWLFCAKNEGSIKFRVCLVMPRSMYACLNCQ